MSRSPSRPWDPRAVVLDFDGTLVQTNIDFGKMRRRTVEQIRAWGLWEEGLDHGRYVLEMIDHSAGKLAADPGLQARYRAEAARMIEQVEMATCASARPFPGAVEALERLRSQGRKLGIITRNCRRAVVEILRHHRLPHDVLLTRDDVERTKPDPAHLLAALELLGVTPAEALMVGDHSMDIACGKAAGTLTCGVLTDPGHREQLERASPDLILPDVAALAELLAPSSPPAL